MTPVLYTFDRRFMRKTFEAIDRSIERDSTYLPLRPVARGCSDEIREVDLDRGSRRHADRTAERSGEVGDQPPPTAVLEETVRAVDPEVIVRNHRFRPDEYTVEAEYPTVHVRHGASIGRGEPALTAADLGDVVDLALAPGERWAERYRELFPDGVAVSVVGIPEADDYVTVPDPRERRVLYAPTNHNYGGGSYLETAEAVLDAFEEVDYDLLFRPHPMDRIEEPGKSLTERCRRRIADMPNVTVDDRDTPRSAVLASDLLISDYSGIIPEWLHTGRPLLQVTDVDADTEVPAVGAVTDEISIDRVDDLYEHGYSPAVERRHDAFVADLGIPMDGRASERAAREVLACTG
jgi:hypothetical protein